MMGWNGSSEESNGSRPSLANPVATFSEVLDATRHEEQRQALRALLMQPILFAGPSPGARAANGAGSRAARLVEEHFVLVRRHQAYLTNWFARYTGWTLILRSSSARLVKRTMDVDDATRGAIDPGSSGGPLSRERYVLWCLSLAVLHQEGRQTTLQRLADGVVRLAESMPELNDAGCVFDLKTAKTRRAIVCVVRLLLGHGLVCRVEGDESQFGEVGSVDCLYDIDSGLLTDVLYLPRSLEAVRDDSRSGERSWLPFSLANSSGHADSEVSPRPRELEHRLIGQLLDNPVLYFDELTEREFQYWQSQRARLLQVVEEATGLVAEIRAEGVALLDPIGDLTDVKMPDAGTIGHATLLISEFVAEQVRVGKQSPESNAEVAAVPMETLQARMAALAREHKSHWRKNVSEPGQAAVLLDEVLQRLEMLRLVRRSRAGIVPLPAICRFAVDRKGQGE